jgi:IclR family acetate operon transcriptional repressor
VQYSQPDSPGGVNAVPQPERPDPSSDRYRVASVVRALQVVTLVADGPLEGLTLSAITRSLGTSKSTAYALVRTLVEGGYVRAVDPGPRYQPGMELVRLGDAATRSIPLGRICHPILLDLSRETGLTTRAAICDDGYPVFVERVDSPGAIRFHTPLGVRELPHTSSAGKAILAALPAAVTERVAIETGLPERTAKTLQTVGDLLADLADVRNRGYALDDEEDAPGVFCVGAAFYDHGGVAGALSATGIKLDLSPARVAELGTAVRAAADRVSLELGGTPRHP